MLIELAHNQSLERKKDTYIGSGRTRVEYSPCRELGNDLYLPELDARTEPSRESCAHNGVYDRTCGAIADTRARLIIGVPVHGGVGI